MSKRKPDECSHGVKFTEHCSPCWWSSENLELQELKAKAAKYRRPNLAGKGRGK